MHYRQGCDRPRRGDGTSGRGGGDRARLRRAVPRLGGAGTDLPLPPELPPERVGILARFIAAIREGGAAPSPNFADGVAVQTDAWVAVAHTD